MDYPARASSAILLKRVRNRSRSLAVLSIVNIKEKDWEAGKPDPVTNGSCPPLAGNHSSRELVAKLLKRSTLRHSGELYSPIFDLASNRVCQQSGFPDLRCTHKAQLFTLSAGLLRDRQRNVFCYTFHSLTASSLSLVFSPVKSRLSSSRCFQQKKRLP